MHSVRIATTLTVLAALLLAGCTARTPVPRAAPDRAAPRPAPRPTGETQTGIASYYAHKYHGRRTASGEIFDMHALTAAHRSLPFGTRVRVTNLANGRSLVLRINDRGPFVRGRIIDVSLRAARDLGFFVQGTTRVRLEVLRG
ncbi:MAG: septal ring lytic transglycosylase RlpA family protein [Candidatus Krumholzibacteriota bacterium]|nr:septal ring lytic transglycosylase RlpA family protein [Candidatus Krumholzibacteriota bacterium]